MDPAGSIFSYYPFGANLDLLLKLGSSLIVYSKDSNILLPTQSGAVA